MSTDELLELAERTGVLVCSSPSRARIWRVWRDLCHAQRRAHVAIRLMPSFVQLEVDLERVGWRLSPALVDELSVLAAPGPRRHRTLPPFVGGQVTGFRVRGKDAPRALHVALRIARGEGQLQGAA